MFTAKIPVDKPSVPDCEYPQPPYGFKGRGITLIYEIPFSRVKKIIPNCFNPDPGKKKIWFMVNFYDWQRFFPLSDSNFEHSFYEFYYKFSVRYQSRLGDYPVKLYLTSDPGIASGIELYGYPKYKADMNFELDDEKGHFKIVQKGVREVEIELEKSKGLLATVTTYFANKTAKSYIDRYVGNFLYQKDDKQTKLICGPTKIKTIKYSLARITGIHMREPLEWKILTEAEILKPKYAFILTDITADLSPPERVFIEK